MTDHNGGRSMAFAINRIRMSVLAISLSCSALQIVSAAEPSAAQVEFFEQKIRPVLVEHCYECHNSAKTMEGGLAVDERAAFLDGGSSGAVIVPGKPGDSRLLPILRHEVDGMKMPQGRGKLDERVIADFEKWIAMGAPDPRDKPPTDAELAEVTTWEGILKKRKQWWSFQPIQPAEPPPENHWSSHPVDRFIHARLQERGLIPNPAADAPALVRRLYFALNGLPPTAEEAEHWTARLAQPAGYSELVEHLLASPHFGERWARHWMDWIRYAESHGSEGDPNIENAWRYRDYLIRALNQDVPYDQLVREHIAGDLLDHPRINPELGINESMIGPAHWRMVFHGFAPTDALDEKVRFIDDEVNTFSKAFLGLTVSCARCHDHKFDPISQRDYYALFGILSSCRPGRTAIDTVEILNKNRAELAALKPRIREALSQQWLAAGPTFRQNLLNAARPGGPDVRASSLLHHWMQLNADLRTGTPFTAAWQKQVDTWRADRQRRSEHDLRQYWRRWKLTQPADYAFWTRVGTSLPDAPSPAGEFSVAIVGAGAIDSIYPGGVYSSLLSSKHPARLTSGDIQLNDNCDLWLRVLGEGGAAARYVVEDYPRNGTVFPVVPLSPEWSWVKFDLSYWNSDPIHIELTTGRDAPLMVNGEARSAFGIREAIIVRRGEVPPPADSREFLDALFQAAAAKSPANLEDLADVYTAAVLQAVSAWRMNSATDAQACLLDACLNQELLPNQLEQLATVKPLIVEYRRLEDEIAVPTRVPGLEETVDRTQHVYARGNHKQPLEAVPHRFLEAIDPTPYQTRGSGRLNLAADLLREKNPLTRRVIVNRLWHHLFGRGIVSTPDNLGRLGQLPTHPELLDYLAIRFQEQGWSIKNMVRFLVTSKTWQTSSHPSPLSLQKDPDNLLWSHSQVRRLEAEAIRDSLLVASGNLSRDLYGSPADGNSTRRSVYVRVNRNSLDPFLRAFDFPEPFSTVGRRDSTNVPAQSLTLLNDNRVAELASAWAARLLSDRQFSHPEQRLQAACLAAFGRPLSEDDLQQFQDYLQATRQRLTDLHARMVELRRQIDERRSSVRALLEPTRTRLLDEAKAKTNAGEQLVPQPIGRWEFETDFKDLVGTAHGQPLNGAVVESGALVVNQQRHVMTTPLNENIRAKTLEAWVQLDTLNQSGGGVMSIQTPDGVIFDAIVFGEQSPRQWLAGSNNFARTQPFNGPQDQDVAGRAVHLAIAYHADGQIVGYRDGQPYGMPYKSNGPQEFRAGQTVIGFGIRHLPAGGNRMLSGRILRANLYNRALSADEIQATSRSVPYYVSETQVLAALTAPQREQVAADRKRILELESEIESLGAIPATVDEQAIWTELARALFTFKEFIYVR